MSDFTSVCDHLLDDLMEEVNGLRPCLPHRYAPWDPGELQAETGEKHLAVWPIGSAVETQAFTTMSQNHVEAYMVLYWEHADDERARGVIEEQAVGDLYTLHDATVARLYALANQVFDGSWSCRYTGTSLPERLGSVRYFALSVQVQRTKEFA